MFKHHGSGFTLIELLIVVAIIAILAAIAVPNFLEAQTRAKVSRAKADMRSIATALEAYRIDSNQYPSASDAHYPAPWATGGDSTPPFHSRVGSLITTPIAYMTSVPHDPFSIQENFLTTVPAEISHRFVLWNFDWFDALYGVSTGIRGAGQAAAGNWLLYSPGPDKLPQNGGGSGSYYMPYDATNGTISFGNIFRSQRFSDGFDYASFVEQAGL